MDVENIGKFIKELREAKGWNQEELASKLYITRQAVSLWENGKSIPDIEKIKLLSDIFNVNIEDLYAGKILNDDLQKKEIIYNVVKNEHRKLKKSFIISTIIVLLLIFLFFVYYFVNSYKSIKVYLIKSFDEQVNVEGLLITSKDKTYFQLSLNNELIKEMTLLYRENEIYTTEDNSISFKDNYGYNEYFNYKSLKDLINNLYLKIIDNEGNEYKIKLELKKDFENEQLLFNQIEEVSEEDDALKSEVPQKILSDFKYEDGNYILNLKNNNVSIDMWYIVDNNEFWVVENKKDILKKWDFFILDNSVVYKEEKSDELVYQFSNKIDSVEDTKEKEILEYFKKNYIEKYLK